MEQGANGGSGGPVIQSKYTGTTGGPEAHSLHIRLQGNDINLIDGEVALVLAATGARSATAVNCAAVSIAGDNLRHAIFTNGALVASVATPSVTYSHGNNMIGASADTFMAGGLYLLAYSPLVLSDAVLADLTRLV